MAYAREQRMEGERSCYRQLDLFRPVAALPDVEQALVEYDGNTRCDRSSRLEYADRVLPQGDFLFSVPMAYLLHEARSTYVNGEFTATILIAQSFIEHWLLPKAVETAGLRARRWGLAAVVDHFRGVGSIHPFLLDRLDDLRRIRNPFSHPKSSEHNVEWRSYHERVSLDVLMHRDARNALGLISVVVRHAS